VNDLSHDDFQRYGRCLMNWADELGKRVGAFEAGHLLFAAGVAQLSNAAGVEATASFLRSLADGIERESN